MKITTKLINTIEIEEWELLIIKQCIAYCLHRLNEHPDSGINKAVRKKDVERLNKELKV